MLVILEGFAIEMPLGWRIFLEMNTIRSMTPKPMSNLSTTQTRTPVQPVFNKWKW